MHPVVTGAVGHDWLSIVTGIGAIATTAGVATGAVLAALYGRRASVSVTASPHVTPSGIIVTARPVVKAVGLFRVKFHATEGVTVRLAEVYIDNSELKEGQFWSESRAFDQQYVDAGEELPTTVVFPPVNPSPSVIGWMVYLNVAAPTRLAKTRSAYWADQVFVPRPDQAGAVASDT